MAIMGQRHRKPAMRFQTGIVNSYSSMALAPKRSRAPGGTRASVMASVSAVPDTTTCERFQSGLGSCRVIARIHVLISVPHILSTSWSAQICHVVTVLNGVL